MIEFVKILPINIEEEHEKREAMNFPYNHVYDVRKSTPKVLRHYKITAMQFLGSLLSSQEFVNRLAQQSEDEANEMYECCNHLAAELIVLIQAVVSAADQHQNKPSAKYWKVLLHHLYHVLDLVNNLLPNSIFLNNVKHLQTHDLLTVRKEILELLNARLLQKKFDRNDHGDLLGLIEHLMNSVYAGEENQSQEYEIFQQTALNSLKLLAKLLAAEHYEVFKPVRIQMHRVKREKSFLTKKKSKEEKRIKIQFYLSVRFIVPQILDIIDIQS